jgi:hypothetical protein
VSRATRHRHGGLGTLNTSVFGGDGAGRKERLEPPVTEGWLRG